MGFITWLFLEFHEKYEHCKTVAPDLTFNTVFIIGFGILYGIKWIFYLFMFIFVYPIKYCRNKSQQRGNPKFRSYFYFLDYTFLEKTGEMVIV